MALSHALAAGVSSSDRVLEAIRRRVGARPFDAVERLAARTTGVAHTSSMGRLFDAIAALAGLRDTASFEGQPAMELEAIAGEDTGWRYAFNIITSCSPWRIDPAPLIRSAIADVGNHETAAHIATAFHESVASMVNAVSLKLARKTGIRSVVLTGGVFQNARLTDGVLTRLAAAGLEAVTHDRVPCNDGGLALGQALYAARLMKAES